MRDPGAMPTIVVVKSFGMYDACDINNLTYGNDIMCVYAIQNAKFNKAVLS